MRVAFLIPYRPDGGPRDEVFRWVTNRIKFFFPASNVYIGLSPEGEFNRAAAINDAYDQILDESVIIINDADTVWNPTAIVSGYHALMYDAKFVLPYETYHLLDKASSQNLLNQPHYSIIVRSEYECEQTIYANPDVYHAPPVSGLLMMRSEDFPRFDERFVGWGEEDVAFVIRTSELLGKPHRTSDSVYHIWHPRSKEYAQPHYGKNQKLLRKEYL